MGCYVNPENMTKDEFLKEFGTLIEPEYEFVQRHYQDKYNYLISGYPKCLPVVLLDNISFKALGVAYSEDEFLAFSRIDDNRMKELWMVDIEELKKVSPISSYIKE